MATYQTSNIKVDPSGKVYDLKDAKAREDLTELASNIRDFDLELNAIKKSVSDGKIVLADAITQKGVNTRADSKLTTMARNILRINKGGGYSGPYYSNLKPARTDTTSGGRGRYIPIFNGYPYVYLNPYKHISGSYAPNTNDIAVIGEYTWQETNDWHVVAQYHNTREDGGNWLNNVFLLGLYNTDTSRGVGVTTDYTYSEPIFVIRGFTLESPNTATAFNIPIDNTVFNQLKDVLFDLHYTYEDGVGHLTFSYADGVYEEAITWIELFSQDITLSPNCFGQPVFLRAPAIIGGGEYSMSRQLHIGEAAFVADGFINWGNSTVYPFREGEIPY